MEIPQTPQADNYVADFIDGMLCSIFTPSSIVSHLKTTSLYLILNMIKYFQFLCKYFVNMEAPSFSIRALVHLILWCSLLWGEKRGNICEKVIAKLDIGKQWHTGTWAGHLSWKYSIVLFNSCLPCFCSNFLWYNWCEKETRRALFDIFLQPSTAIEYFQGWITSLYMWVWIRLGTYASIGVTHNIWFGYQTKLEVLHITHNLIVFLRWGGWRGTYWELMKELLGMYSIYAVTQQCASVSIPSHFLFSRIP